MNFPKPGVNFHDFSRPGKEKMEFHDFSRFSMTGYTLKIKAYNSVCLLHGLSLNTIVYLLMSGTICHDATTVLEIYHTYFLFSRI